MRLVSVTVYLILFFCIFICFYARKERNAIQIKNPVIIFVKNHIHIWMFLLVINTVSFGMTFYQEDSEKEICISKEGYAGEEKEVSLLLSKGEQEERMTLTVSPQRLTEAQRKTLMKEAFHVLEDTLKGENPSLEKVTTDLSFFLDYEKYPFDVEFLPDDYMLMDGNGRVKNDKEALQELGYKEKDWKSGIPTKVTVVLWYGEISEKKEFPVLLFLKEQNETEKEFERVKDILSKKEKEAQYKESVLLPSSVQDIRIRQIDASGLSSIHILLFGILFTGLLLIREKENQRQTLKVKQENLYRAYPWFVNEFGLLLGAGMQIKNILVLLVKEYEREKEIRIEADYRSPLIEELKRAIQQLELGEPEEQVYYRLGRRLGLPCYIKMMTILEQNVKRGSKGVAMLFEQEEIHALEERKNLAKRYGEEASTKLLGPMILLLLVIMLLILIPAYLSFMI